MDKRHQVAEWRRALSQAADLSCLVFRPRTMNLRVYISAIVGVVTGWINKKEEEEEKLVGYGADGIFYAARHRETGDLCAAQELNIRRAENDESIRHGIKSFSQLEKHPNIVEYYGHKEEGGRISLYMEYIQPGSLKKYISESKRGKLDEPLIQNFTAQILFGLVHLHSNGRVHRDLKPANLLVDSKNIVKLVDFGLAKLIEESKGMCSVPGTQLYAAPEVVGNQNYQRLHEVLATDIWSLGCVIIEMSSGSPPRWSTSDSHPHIPEELCQEGKDFLELCFKIEPAERPSAEELLENPFVKAQVEVVKNTGLYKD